MKSSNICKFSNTRSGDLLCSGLVLETTDIQSTSTVSSQHILGIITEGNGELILDAERYSLSKNDVFLIPKNTPYKISIEEDSNYLYIRFSGKRADELLYRVGVKNCAKTFQNIDSSNFLSEFALNTIKSANEKNLDLLGESVLLYAIAQLDPCHQSEDSLLASIKQITDDNFTDPSFSLPVLAQIMGYDAKYLSFYFKKKSGIGYTKYIRDMRIDHAIFLMEQGLVSVKNIAVLSGFSDALYFSKVFKNCKGISPKDYINNSNYKI